MGLQRHAPVGQALETVLWVPEPSGQPPLSWSCSTRSDMVLGPGCLSREGLESGHPAPALLSHREREKLAGLERWL